VRVSELASNLEINPDTVRYYTRIGLLHPRKNATNGYKEYDERDISRLNFIISARRLGFSIEDVKHILEVSDQNETPCPIVRTLIEQRLRETESQYQQLTLLRNRMQEAVKLWQELPDRNPTVSTLNCVPSPRVTVIAPLSSSSETITGDCELSTRSLSMSAIFSTDGVPTIQSIPHGDD